MGNLDSKAFSSALGDFERSALAALDLMQHGLAGAAERLAASASGTNPSGTSGTNRARTSSVRRIRHGDPGGCLLAGEQPVAQPAADREVRDAELLGGAVDRDKLAVGVRWRRGWDAGAEPGALHAGAGERQALAGASCLGG